MCPPPVLGVFFHDLCVRCLSTFRISAAKPIVVFVVVLPRTVLLIVGLFRQQVFIGHVITVGRYVGRDADARPLDEWRVGATR